ncbi:hypothetical protein ACEPAI_7272 [Sanghuangporus weigelae]
MLGGASARFIRNLNSSSPPRLRRSMKSLAAVPNPLPATFLRGGTSKGIYIRQEHLPSDRAEWGPIFLGIMGSPDPEHGRQLNGMGGGVSSLSKICVVGPPTDALSAQGIDVDYTFCQVGIRDANLDYTGNCGNLSSMIGVFAVDEGICNPRVSPDRPEIGVVRAFNTNTRKRVDTSFPVSAENGLTPILDLPQVTIAGVPGLASRIDLHFVSPAGARTGKLLPTGSPVDTLTVDFEGKKHLIQASLVDATNPSIFVLNRDVASMLSVPGDLKLNFGDSHVEECIEAIRQSGACAMGLDPKAKAQPKIAALEAPASQPERSEHPHIIAHAFSMGVLHKAIPMTLGLCLGVAARIEGTLPWQIVSSASGSQQLRDEVPGTDRCDGQYAASDLVRIRHPSGDVDVGAEFGRGGSLMSAKVVRTGRRLMKGVVWW